MNPKNILPSEIDIKIERSNEKFNVILNEISWMFCDVNVGQKVVWGMYDQPNCKLQDSYSTKTIRNAIIHGVDCIESELIEYNELGNFVKEISYFSKVSKENLQFFALKQIVNNTLVFESIYDENFQQNWGVESKRIFKHDEIELINENEIKIELENIEFGTKIYELTVNNVSHKCLRVIERTSDILDILIESFIDKDGNTILFRRYNSEDYNFKNMKNKWKETYPKSNIIVINGKEYIHWYDCISNKTLDIKID